MQTNKLHGYSLNLLITLFLCMGVANAAEKAKCFVELDKEIITAITGKPSNPGYVQLLWEVKDQHTAKSINHVLTSPLSKNPNDIISSITYTISGETLVKSSGDNHATYDSLGHIVSFDGTANGGVPYTINLDNVDHELVFSFNRMIYYNAICEVVYDGDLLHQTVHFPSPEKWNSFMKANPLQTTADQK